MMQEWADYLDQLKADTSFVPRLSDHRNATSRSESKQFVIPGWHDLDLPTTFSSLAINPSAVPMPSRRIGARRLRWSRSNLPLMPLPAGRRLKFLRWHEGRKALLMKKCVSCGGVFWGTKLLSRELAIFTPQISCSDCVLVHQIKNT